MAKLKRTEKPVAQPTKPDSPSAPAGLIQQFWADHRGALIPLAGLYLLIAIFFAPVVFQGKNLSPAADMVAAAGMYKMGEEAIASGNFPLWNPTLFSGLPMFASLQYALFVYPPEYLIRFFSHIFGGGNYRIWLFHYLIAGFLAYLLARHYKCGRLASWLTGVAYGFSPQLIVLADVGHGSKLMAMTWLPLIWLLLERLRAKPSVGRMAALGAAFAVVILALHPQVAAYGAMLMGLYLVYWGVAAVRESAGKGKLKSPATDYLTHDVSGTLKSPTKEYLTPDSSGRLKSPASEYLTPEGGFPASSALPAWGKLIGWFSGAMVLSLMISAILWLSVLDYARFSTRGGIGGGDAVSTGGGVSWEYATGWSFHPLESLTYIQPYFYGFGNETYWGTVGTPDGTPFTHNPMYFGVVVLLLAIIAMTLTPRKVWGFALTLALAAWALSWGKYFPILYGPFYHILPMFNKFRAPVMGQILLLLPMALLAGVGLEALIKRIREGSLSKSYIKVIGILAGIMVLRGILTMSDGFVKMVYATIANFVRPGTDPRLLDAARALAQPDLVRISFLLAILFGLIWAASRKKIPATALSGVIIIALLVDLWPINTKLVTFTAPSSVEALFQPEGVVKRLQKDTEKYRIAPLDNRYKPANWWSYFGIESVGGYFGAKPGAYQKLMTAAGLETWDCAFRNPKVLDVLNVKYVILTLPLDYLFGELEKQGHGAAARPANQWQIELMPRENRPGAGPFMYRNTSVLPRARLVGEFRVIPDVDATIAEMVNGRTWEPAREALLDKEPSVRPEPGGDGSVKIDEYLAERITLSATLPFPKLLVLADEYYTSGWTVTIDGVKGEILRADGVLRGVALPAGDHKIVFAFRPKLFYAGLWTSLISLLLVIGIGVAAVMKRRQ